MQNNKYASFLPTKEWKALHEFKYYEKKKNYNDIIRDQFFREIINILKKNYDGNFFINYGTLLGLIRNSDFIDWDDNIDLAFYLNSNSLTKLENLQKILIDANYVARIKSKKEEYLKLSIFKYGYKLDFCSLKKIKKFYYSNDTKIPTEYCENLKSIKFKGVSVFIPLEYEKYLSYLYGDWKTPRKDHEYQSLKSMDFNLYSFFILSMKRFIKFLIKND